MQYNLTLIAGQKQSISYRGRVFVLLDTGVASSVKVRLVIPGGGDRNDEEIDEAKRGFAIRLVSGHFDKIEVTSPVNATVKLIVSDNDVDINVFDGATVNANILANPLPVSNDRGTPGNLMHVTAVTVSDSPATSATAAAPAAAVPAGVVVFAAAANRREARFVNLGPDPVAIVPPGGTWAQRVIVLELGDVWVETRGANLAWNAITDAGKAASVGRQEVLA